MGVWSVFVRSWNDLCGFEDVLNIQMCQDDLIVEDRGETQRFFKEVEDKCDPSEKNEGITSHIVRIQTEQSK